MSAASHQERRALLALIAIVLVNYIAQIPYSLHLYGLHPNPWGALLLGVTFVWFAAGAALLSRGRPAGYWLLLSFLMVEFVFYFRNEIMLIPAGYGLPYHLTHAGDALLWVVFFIGDVNFFAAGWFIWYLVRRRQLWT